jgi:hypothetical protein
MTRRIFLVLLVGLLYTGSPAAAAPQGEAPPKQKDEKQAAKLTTAELDALWTDLAGKDAAKAYRAIWALVAAPEQSVPFLGGRLRKDTAPEGGRITQLVRDLDSKRFNERQKAMVELEKLGPLAKSALEAALATKPSLEVKLRIEQLLDKISSLTLSADELRVWRALEALELIGNAAAQRVLRTLGEGARGTWQTEEARAALERLGKRPPATP